MLPSLMKNKGKVKQDLVKQDSKERKQLPHMAEGADGTRGSTLLITSKRTELTAAQSSSSAASKQGSEALSDVRGACSKFLAFTLGFAM